MNEWVLKITVRLHPHLNYLSSNLSLENNKNVMWPLWFENFIWFWNKFCVPMCFCSRILQLLHPPFSEKVGYLQEKAPSPSLRSRQPGAGNFSTPEFQHCAVLGREPPRDSRQIFFRPGDFLQRGDVIHRAKKKSRRAKKLGKGFNISSDCRALQVLFFY